MKYAGFYSEIVWKRGLNVIQIANILLFNPVVYDFTRWEGSQSNENYLPGKSIIFMKRFFIGKYCYLEKSLSRTKFC